MKTKVQIVLVDDEEALCRAVGRLLSQEGYAVTTYGSAQEALDMQDWARADLLITDLLMPQMDGIELLKRVKEKQPALEAIMITAHGTVERAVEAMRLGAYDFIEKPIDPNAMIKAVAKAVEKRRLVAENRRLREQLARKMGEESLVGNAASMVVVKKLIRQIAPSDVSVLIQGESGTGKEIIADIIHTLSPRASAPLVKISCAAIPETLLESELFGYEKGAFTGAVGSKLGKFELAHSGSLFLDEIAEMSTALQAKLLRVLQDGRVQRLGSTRDVQTDVRIVSATHVDLRHAIEEKKFREDLYYRLNVIQINLPPLRDRREDIPLLADHFLQKHASRMQKEVRQITAGAMQQLLEYEWPGNVRELENVLQRALALAAGDAIEQFEIHAPRPSTRGLGSKGAQFQIPHGTPLSEAEDHIIAETLKQCGGNKEKAAYLLGITSRTLLRWTKRTEGKNTPKTLK